MSAIGYFQANNNPVALATLGDFAAGRSNVLSISGCVSASPILVSPAQATDVSPLAVNGSTAVESLTQAFMAIKLSTTLEGLTSKLVNYANLTVLPTTGYGNSIVRFSRASSVADSDPFRTQADGVVSLQNPFSSELVITNIQSNVTSHGLFVGSIVVDTDFRAAGNTASNSPPLAL